MHTNTSKITMLKFFDLQWPQHVTLNFSWVYIWEGRNYLFETRFYHFSSFSEIYWPLDDDIEEF